MNIPVVDLEQQLASESPQAIIDHALASHGRIAISFSGAEDVALIDMAARSGKPFQVFSLDTGRLHAATYRFIETVRKHYDVKIDVLFPDTQLVNKLVAEKGLFSFYEDNHQECCGIRKVLPLKNKLLELDAWITGQRRDQSPGTRAQIPVIQEDRAFARPGEQLVKYNPLSSWSSAQVWQYIRDNGVPYNELHDQGFISIGCEPCTRPLGPNQHEREGRWWWEEATKKECGLHGTNIKK